VGVPRQSTALGVALGVAAGLFYSGYLLGGKGLLARGMTAYQLTAAAFLGPALVYAAAVGIQGFRPPSGAVGWSSLAGVVVLGTIVPTLLLFSGMRLIDAGTTSMLSTVEPLVGVILAYAVLGESLSALQLLGGGLVVSAVATLSLPRFAAAPTSAQLQREEGDTVAAPAPLAVTTSAGDAGDCGEIGGARVRAAPE
jgi:drug/metabolite transporter (DMT)-like permease